MVRKNALIYNGLLSRNLKTFKFVLQVILRSKSSLKFFIKRFLIQSDLGSLVYSKQANPSWRYKPILCFPTSHPSCGEYINQLPPTNQSYPSSRQNLDVHFHLSRYQWC